MFDFNSREREISELEIKQVGDDRFITAHYYVRADYPLEQVAKKVASHQSTAAAVYGRESLLERCSAKVSQVEYRKGDKEGLISLSFPVELFGEKVYAGDILHIVSGAVQNDESQHRIFYLIDVEIPEGILRTFPGPRFGAGLFERASGFMVGTIIKPCSGIDLGDYERIVKNLLAVPQLRFIKEDENLFPSFPHCPLEKRVKIAAQAIEQSGRNVLFAPHISSNPLDFFDNLKMVAEAGLPAVMFSETYYGGLLRAARDFILQRGWDLAIYAHNGGICTRTTSINRVLLDRLARLDGADLRQTAPSGDNCYLRPLAWQRDLVEEVLTREESGLARTVCVRAGGLDQGNLLRNLHECADKKGNYLFLMGSAINSIKNDEGEYDVGVAMAGINEVMAMYDRGINIYEIDRLYEYALRQGLDNLAKCLRQRYSHEKLRASRAVEGAG